jgi:hypothetical protein
MLARVPKLCRLSDLVRRSHIPEDLDFAASNDAEVDPAEVDQPPDYTERVWQRMRLMYRCASRRPTDGNQ